MEKKITIEDAVNDFFTRPPQYRTKEALRESITEVIKSMRGEIFEKCGESHEDGGLCFCPCIEVIDNALR